MNGSIYISDSQPGLPAPLVELLEREAFVEHLKGAQNRNLHLCHYIVKK